MKSYSCDHCGQSIGLASLAPGRGIAAPDGWLAVRVTALGRGVDKTPAQYDICSDCRDECEAFLGAAR